MSRSLCTTSNTMSRSLYTTSNTMSRSLCTTSNTMSRSLCTTSNTMSRSLCTTSYTMSRSWCSLSFTYWFSSTMQRSLCLKLLLLTQCQVHFDLVLKTMSRARCLWCYKFQGQQLKFWECQTFYTEICKVKVKAIVFMI